MKKKTYRTLIIELSECESPLTSSVETDFIPFGSTIPTQSAYEILQRETVAAEPYEVE